jgi:hypothetical protein
LERSLKRAVGSPLDEEVGEEEDEERGAAAPEGEASQSPKGSTIDATGTAGEEEASPPDPSLHQATARASPAVDARTSMNLAGFSSSLCPVCSLVCSFEVDADLLSASASALA